MWKSLRKINVWSFEAFNLCQRKWMGRDFLNPLKINLDFYSNKAVIITFSDHSVRAGICIVTVSKIKRSCELHSYLLIYSPLPSQFRLWLPYWAAVVLHVIQILFHGYPYLCRYFIAKRWPLSTASIQYLSTPYIPVGATVDGEADLFMGHGVMLRRNVNDAMYVITVRTWGPLDVGRGTPSTCMYVLYIHPHSHPYCTYVYVIVYRRTTHHT